MYWLRSLCLLLLLISLNVIYFLTTPDTILLVVLCLIFIAGVALMFVPGDAGLAMMGGVMLVMSIGAAVLGGLTWIGVTGAIILPLIWVLLIFSLWWMLWRTTTYVRNHTILLTRSPYRSHPFIHKGPAEISPLRRLLLSEQPYAVIPVYELVSHVHVETINTRGLQNIMGITVEIRYHIDAGKNTDLPAVIQSFLNQAQGLEREFNLPLDQVMLRTDFWERLLDNKLHEVCDSLLRTIVYAHINQAVDASDNRQLLAENLRQTLQERIDRWEINVKIIDLTIPSIKLDPEQIKRKFQNKIKENQDAARMEATKIYLTGIAQARIQAHAIKKWIIAIQQAGVALSPQEIEQIVFNALEKLQEKQRIEMTHTNPASNGSQQPILPIPPQ